MTAKDWVCWTLETLVIFLFAVFVAPILMLAAAIGGMNND